MQSRLVGIIGAMGVEIRHLLSVLEGSESVKMSNMTFHKGTIAGVGVVIAQCGVGKVNAARVTQLMIDSFSPDMIVNTGVAGGVAPDLEVNDVVIASSLVQHDFDASYFGYAPGYMCTGHAPDKPTRYQADEELSALLERAVKEHFRSAKVVRGIIASGDQFIADPEKRQWIYRTFGASACEMESCAIAQSAALSGVPFAILRVLSDNADGKSKVEYERFEKEAADNSAKTLEHFLHLLSQIM